MFFSFLRGFSLGARNFKKTSDPLISEKIARRTIVARGYSFLTRICKFAIGGSDLSLLVIIDHN